MPQLFEIDHPYPGKLIIVEGIDGSGKSTQLRLLNEWLRSLNYRVFLTEWNSSALVKETIRRGKKKNLLTPITFSILHATDFASRYTHMIIPPLKAGMIVLADRYIYTAFARDVIRGVNREWVHALYGFAIKPNLSFYFDVPVEISLKRILAARINLKFYESGMDIEINNDPKESFKIFQSKILEEYKKIDQEYNFTVIDAKGFIKKQQIIVRETVKKMLEGYQPNPIV